MIQPNYTTFCQLARQGNLMPVYDTFANDLLTPVSAYLRLARDARYAFLLESVEGGEKIARYTFLGANPVEVFRYARGGCVVEGEGRLHWMQANPIQFLRGRIGRYRPVRLPGLPPLVGGAIGYFSYDMVRLVERIPGRHRDDVGLDDAIMMFYVGLVAFDHVQHRIWIVRNVFTEGEGSLRAQYGAAVREIAATRRALKQATAGPIAAQRRRAGRLAALPVTSNFQRCAYLAAVRKAKRYIRAGDIFQVVLSQCFAVRTKADPSPGPGIPQEAGISIELIRGYAGKVPILGVCLGHQAIGYAFGGKVVRAPAIMHGKTSEIRHDGKTIFRKLPQRFMATRYHSLVVARRGLPRELVISAETRDGTIMGLRHRTLRVEGVQFHPESVLTDVGMKILRNFLEL